MKPELTVLSLPALNSRALYLDGKLIVQADPSLGDPLYLIDEAAEQLAASHRVAINYRTASLNRLPESPAPEADYH